MGLELKDNEYYIEFDIEEQSIPLLVSNIIQDDISHQLFYDFQPFMYNNFE